MRGNWQKDKVRADKYLRHTKAILGVYLIGEPRKEEDCLHNTDLMVLRMEAVRIACRVRSMEYWHKCYCQDGRKRQYRDEFTLRTTRPTGTKTELKKIVTGWGDYFFYGFGEEDTAKVRWWHLGDLKVFREWYDDYRTNHDGAIPGLEQANKDGSSDFRVFTWSELPAEFILAQDPAIDREPPTSPMGSYSAGQNTVEAAADASRDGKQMSLFDLNQNARPRTPGGDGGPTE